MVQRFLDAAPLRLAILAGLLAALGWFFLRPAPEAQKPFTGGVPIPVWAEYRDADFYHLADGLDLSDPACVVAATFEAFRNRDFRRVLAHSTDRLQLRYSPELLQRRRLRAFTSATAADIVGAHMEPEVAIILVRIHDPEDTSIYRCVLRLERGAEWRVDGILPEKLNESLSPELEDLPPGARPPTRSVPE